MNMDPDNLLADCAALAIRIGRALQEPLPDNERFSSLRPRSLRPAEDMSSTNQQGQPTGPGITHPASSVAGQAHPHHRLLGL